MKQGFHFFPLIISLVTSLTILSMEKSNNHDTATSSNETISVLPNEIWEKVINYSYYQVSGLSNAKSIFEVPEIIEKHLFEVHTTISLVCKTFHDLNMQKNILSNLKKEILNRYLTFFKEDFLEKREGKHGLYPKNDDWSYEKKTNKEVALFFETNYEKYLKNKKSIIKDQRLVLTLLYSNISNKLRHRLLRAAIDSYVRDDSSCIDTIKLILNFGIDINKRPTKFKVTPLEHILIKAYSEHTFSYRSIEVIKLLLKFGANLNSPDRIGKYPLDCAIVLKNKKLVKLFLTHGANPQNKTGFESAYQIAEKNIDDFPELVKKFYKEEQ